MITTKNNIVTASPITVIALSCTYASVSCPKHLTIHPKFPQHACTPSDRRTPQSCCPANSMLVRSDHTKLILWSSSCGATLLLQNQAGPAPSSSKSHSGALDVVAKTLLVLYDPKVMGL
ncbi:hypothetical protein GALMADRAFT_487089 [Galerina marginata CBS 339.88]|uniref:Uncharacterized protein n=1 Tax=Galerina marginata (strain CBS 339.88) TaxID=685588 RepID=A0A067SX94_GALM3|nr:hypothetical protein GALMADRAFT_487089 [Galerina marginata CBS 339.88]